MAKQGWGSEPQEVVVIVSEGDGTDPHPDPKTPKSLGPGGLASDFRRGRVEAVTDPRPQPAS